MITKDRLTQIAREALRNPDVDMNSTMETVSEWDSVGQLSMLVALDTATDGASAAIDGMAACRSLNEIHALLKAHKLAE